MGPPSKTNIDRLGARLRASERVSDEDLELLQQVRAAYDDTLAAVADRLAAIELDGSPLRPTSRLKTVGTILDKLKRQPRMRLSQMDDIAGVRVVIRGDRVDQDRVVDVIQEHFDTSTMRDRREYPSFGYRAVHVIVEEDRRRVEVQVRTPLQDLWAQVIERISDSWGREIRYGAPPDSPDEEFLGGVTRRQLVESLIGNSDIIDRLEQAQAELRALRSSGEIDDEARTEIERLSERVRRALETFEENLRPFTEFDF